MLRLSCVVCALASLGCSQPAVGQNAAAFQWIKQVDSSGQDTFAGLGIDAAGNVYIAGSTYSPNFPVLNAVQNHLSATSVAASDVYVAKLDPSGNLVYSTYFGGSGNDAAAAMTVDPSGDVYVTGSTASVDFPVTQGAYAATGGSFVFKLKPDGSLGYSTLFAPAGNTPAAVAVDSSGSVYITGTSFGGLPTTAGAYEPVCDCGENADGFIASLVYRGFASKLDASGSTLLYSTYAGPPLNFENLITSLAVGADGTAYLGGASGILHLNATGSTLLASIPAPSYAPPFSFAPQALGVAADGTLYAAGYASAFPTTPGAFETSVLAPPSLPGGYSQYPAVIARWDSQLANVLDATYFGADDAFNAIAFDAAGDVFLGGQTVQQGLPTRTPLQLGFAPRTGFLSELSGDLSTLLFSSYFGDTQDFGVGAIGVANNGSVVLGGPALPPIPAYVGNPNIVVGNPWINSLTLVPAPTVRVDSVVNAASMLDGPISAGETIVVQGAGFGAKPQLSIGGVAVPAISSTSTSITATVPQSVTSSVAEVEVSTAGGVSNQVVVEVTPTSPGIFSQSGSGFGQGYILNNDGTLNSPTNPAVPGEAISVFATGVGPVSIEQGYAVSQYPVNVQVGGFLTYGIEAFMGPVAGLPGNVYEIQVYVPPASELIRISPGLFPPARYPDGPPLVLLNMVVNGVSSQNGLALSISQ